MVVSNKKSAVKELLCLVGNSLSWRVVFRRVLHQLEVPEYGSLHSLLSNVCICKDKAHTWRPLL